MKIINLMAEALNMKDEDVKVMFEEGSQSMRMNYYPPCPKPELVTGLCPHSDAVGLTILLQVNEMEGLQIKKDGIWIPVSPLPGALVVNIGDILEVMYMYNLTPHALFFKFTETIIITVTSLTNTDCDKWYLPEH